MVTGYKGEGLKSIDNKARRLLIKPICLYN